MPATGKPPCHFAILHHALFSVVFFLVLFVTFFGVFLSSEIVSKTLFMLTLILIFGRFPNWKFFWVLIGVGGNQPEQWEASILSLDWIFFWRKGWIKWWLTCPSPSWRMDSPGSLTRNSVAVMWPAAFCSPPSHRGRGNHISAFSDAWTTFQWWPNHCSCAWLWWTALEWWYTSTPFNCPKKAITVQEKWWKPFPWVSLSFLQISFYPPKNNTICSPF